MRPSHPGDLIHKLLRQPLPSGSGGLLGDVIGPLLYTAWCGLYTQAGGRSYGDISTVGRVDGCGIVFDIHQHCGGSSCSGSRWWLGVNWVTPSPEMSGAP